MACRLNACAPSAARANPSRRCVAAMEKITATNVSSISTPARTRRTYECNTKGSAVSYFLSAITSFSPFMSKKCPSTLLIAWDTIFSVCLTRIHVMNHVCSPLVPFALFSLCTLFTTSTFYCFSFTYPTYLRYGTPLLILIFHCFASPRHFCGVNCYFL